VNGSRRRRAAVLGLVALAGLALLLAGCAAGGDRPSWQRESPFGCRQNYGTRGSTSQTRPDLIFFCAESP
jgi:hypothetical protein